MTSLEFEHLSQQFLQHYRNYVKENTIYEYENKVKQINKYMANTNIKDINLILVNNILNDIAKEKGLSKSTFNKYKITINKILKYGYDIGEFNKNICLKNIKYPKFIKENKNILPLSSEQINELLIYCKTNNKVYPLLLLYTGMRRSEALALQVKDIDFDNNIIFVTKRLLFKNSDTYIENKLKNGDSLRTIPLIDELIFVLKKHIKNKKSDDYLFVTKTNKLFNKNYINRYWGKINQEIGFKLNQHQLRHTYCTFLYQSGLDIKNMQKILGHRNISVTLNTYTNIDKHFQMKKIGELKVFLDKSISKYIDENFSSNE